MSRFKLGQITQESLLASEELSEQTAKAEASTPQAYLSFIEASEEKGLKDREKQAEEREDDFGGEDLDTGDESGDGTDNNVPPADGDTPTDGDNTGNEEEGELNLDDAMDDTSTAPEEETKEALDDWIREKTQDSDSKVVRGMGSAAAGLAKLGITYGPGLMQALWSGAIWTFSRVGTMIFAGGEYLSEMIERSNNSSNKLEARLKNAEAIIAKHINDGQEATPFKYKNSKVLAYLQAGNSLEIAANLRSFASSMTTTNSAIADEFAAGAESVNRLAASAAKDRVTSLSAFMKVDNPSRGFRPGAPAGYDKRGDAVDMFHSEPIWPGDATLVFAKPKNSDDLGEISKAYKAADMFVANTDRTKAASEQLAALSPTDLIMIAKSTKMVLSACREVAKSQSKLAKYDEALSNAVKRTFFALADSQAKGDNKEAITQMVYLRSHLVTKVYTKGSAALATHASRVASAAIQLLEEHAKRMTPAS